MIEGRHFAAATVIGARKRQEDAWSVQVVTDDDTGEGLLLAAVADGMGGLPAGDQASRITLRNFVGSFPLVTKPPAQRLRPALAHANHRSEYGDRSRPVASGNGLHPGGGCSSKSASTGSASATRTSSTGAAMRWSASTRSTPTAANSTPGQRAARSVRCAPPCTPSAPRSPAP